MLVHFSRLLDHLGYSLSIVQNIDVFSGFALCSKTAFYAAQSTGPYSLQEI